MQIENPKKQGIYTVKINPEDRRELGLWNGRTWEFPGEGYWRRTTSVSEWTEYTPDERPKVDRISASDRVMLATRTEAPVTPEMLQRFQNVMAIRLLHAGIGLATEAGEFLDQLKKHLFYGKPLDMQNLREELGDSDWYMNLCCDVLNTTMALIEAANIRKLATRYGEKFSEDKALLRNISAELAALDDVPQEHKEHGNKQSYTKVSRPGDPGYYSD